MRNKIDEILSKVEINDRDANILAENINLLTKEEKIRLGFEKASVEEAIKNEPVVTEEVIPKKTRGKKVL